MLFPITQLIRRSASEEPERRMIGLNPESFAAVEPSEIEGVSLLYCDGRDKPYLVEASVEEIIGAVQCLECDESEGESE